MRFLFSLFIALIFMLIAFLEKEGYLDIGHVNIFSVEELGGFDMYFIEDFAQKLLIVPEAIFNVTKEGIDKYTPDNYFFSDNYINLYIIGLYYFVFSYITLLLAGTLSYYRDKVYLGALIVLSYILVLYLV